jgi:outer membrane protein OmpA-like peptidoglycan-associated protein
LFSSFSFYSKGQVVQGSSRSILYGTIQRQQFHRSSTIDTVARSREGIGIHAIRSVKDKLDLSYSLSGTFTDAALKQEAEREKRLFFTGAFATRFRFLSPQDAVQPYLSAGAALSYYHGNWGGYAIPGLGMQARYKEVYFLVHLQYQVALSPAFRSYVSYGLGIGGVLKRQKGEGLPKTNPIQRIAVNDRDGDGIEDPLDQCPDVPGLAIFKGCPDSDGDGIPDIEDRCPVIKGLAKYNGCPPPDTDGDGISDEQDSCVTVPGFIKYNGCPVPDTDGDGINDEEDVCISLPGVREYKGCPPVPAETITKLKKAARNVFFKTGSYEILPASFPALAVVKDILKENSALKLLIEGHTDNRGDSAANVVLSQQRALAVSAYFTQQGIAAERLNAKGYGDQLPEKSNETAAGRAANRRVVFKLFY